MFSVVTKLGRNTHLIGTPNRLRLRTLGKISGESESPFRILHDPAELPPTLQRLIGWVLRLHIAEVFVQVVLHFLSLVSNNEWIRSYFKGDRLEKERIKDLVNREGRRYYIYTEKWLKKNKEETVKIQWSFLTFCYFTLAALSKRNRWLTRRLPLSELRRSFLCNFWNFSWRMFFFLNLKGNLIYSEMTRRVKKVKAT